MEANLNSSLLETEEVKPAEIFGSQALSLGATRDYQPSGHPAIVVKSPERVFAVVNLYLSPWAAGIGDPQPVNLAFAPSKDLSWGAGLSWIPGQSAKLVSREIEERINELKEAAIDENLTPNESSLRGLYRALATGLVPTTANIFLLPNANFRAFQISGSMHTSLEFLSDAWYRRLVISATDEEVSVVESGDLWF